MTITDQNGGTVYDLGTYSTARSDLSRHEVYADCDVGQHRSAAQQFSECERLLRSAVGAEFAGCAAGPFGPSPVPTLFGNSGIGIIQGPGQFNWDISFIKTTRIREGNTLIFRAEFFKYLQPSTIRKPRERGFDSKHVRTDTTTTVNPRLIQFAVKYQF